MARKEHSFRHIEPHADWRALGVSTVINIAVIILSFSVFALLGNPIFGLYVSFIALGFSSIITVFGWIVWSYRKIKDRTVAAVISIASLVVLFFILMIVSEGLFFVSRFF